jgi:hypothetical protein
MAPIVISTSSSWLAGRRVALAHGGGRSVDAGCRIGATRSGIAASGGSVVAPGTGPAAGGFTDGLVGGVILCAVDFGAGSGGAGSGGSAISVDALGLCTSAVIQRRAACTMAWPGSGAASCGRALDAGGDPGGDVGSGRSDASSVYAVPGGAACSRMAGAGRVGVATGGGVMISGGWVLVRGPSATAVIAAGGASCAPSISVIPWSASVP